MRLVRPAEHELLDQVVPAAAAADLHDVHLKLAPSRFQRRQLRTRTGLPSRSLQFVSVYVIDVREILAATDGATLLRRIAVKSGSAHQVRRSIANLINA